MVLHKFSRNELLIGPEGQQILNQSKVAVFGVGGVGSFTVEALARAGIGQLVLVDYDDICLTNINRQLHALHSTVGCSKVEVMADRVRDINRAIQVTTYKEFYSPEKSESLLQPDYDYVIDAIDTVTAKIDLIVKARAMNLPIVSCMGAGNKMDPTQIRVGDISETTICPLAKVVRKELKKKGIASGVKVVFSLEPPLKPQSGPDCKTHCICPNKDANCARRRQIPGSISFVPPVAGLILAGVVIKDLLRWDNIDNK